MNIIDNPPPLPDELTTLLAPYPLQLVRVVEAAAFARGVAAYREEMQKEIARLTEHLAERGVALVFQGEQLQKAVAERDELRAKLQALEEQEQAVIDLGSVGVLFDAVITGEVQVKAKEFKQVNNVKFIGRFQDDGGPAIPVFLSTGTKP